MDSISQVIGKINEGIQIQKRKGLSATKLEMSFGTYAALLYAWINMSGKPDPDMPILTHLVGLRIMFNPKVAMWHVVVK